MDNEKDLYNTARFKKLNIGLKEEDDIIYERVPKNTAPVVRKQRPTFSRHTTLEVKEPSTPHQSRPIEEVNLSRQRKEEMRKDIPSYARPSSYSRQSRANETRPSNGRPVNGQRSVRPNEARPSSSQRPVRPNENRPSNESYVNGQRSTRTSDSRQIRQNNENRMPRNIKKRGGFTGFKKFITIYSAILLVIVIAVMLVLSSFVSNYEKNQPTVLAASIASSLTNDSKKYLSENKDKISCLENVDAIIEKSAEMIGENKVSYNENRDYRAEAPSFDFKVDNNIVAKITFEIAKKGAFGLNTWKIKTLDIAEYIPDTISYTLYSPEGATVKINDNEIGDTYKTADLAVPEVLQAASKLTEVPSYVTYKVSGFTNTPVVNATDANGTELGVTITSDTIVVGATTSEEFINSKKDRVNDAIDNWAKYFISYGGRLGRYIDSRTELYAYIFGSDEYDPIPTQFYDSDYISSVEFPVKESTNYIQYTDDCFSVDVKYEMKVNFTTDRLNDENQKLNATWVWLYDPSWGDWYIIDCIYK